MQRRSTVLLELFLILFCLTNAASTAEQTHKRDRSPSPTASHKRQKGNESGIRITYYNVGQGNCVLMEHEGKQQAVLVDCGSKEKNDKMRTEFKKPQININEVNKKIKHKLEQYKNKFIFVTHADEDHYNQIAPILGESKDIPIIISTGPDIHNKEKQKSIENLEESLTLSEMKKVSKIKDPKELKEVLETYNLADWIEGVAAAASTEHHPSTNADSIVINAYSGKCSALLTGDAEALIGRQAKTRKLSTTVLLASHHGSATEGSNSEKWINAAAPQAVIVSAGHNAAYRHPRCSIIQHYLISQHLEKGNEHPLTCGTDFLDFKSRRPLDLELDPEFTGLQAIYNTFDQGDIKVELDTAASGEDAFIISSINDGLLLSGICK